jgi:predicted DNA-binding transcriptional regulator AlpA
MEGQNAQPINESRFLTDAQVANITGRARSTLAKDRLARTGIPYHKIGRLVRYQWADVLEYMRQHRIETN